MTSKKSWIHSFNTVQENNYDIIIVGGGPAGLTAGLYASRSKMRTLLLERMGCGGQNAITDWIENYPGFPEGINGFELASKFEEQARKFGLEIKTEGVISIESTSQDISGKAVRTENGVYAATAVVIAAGASFKNLNVPGEVELRGKGVSYCATCDAPFFKEKDVAVVGGGNSAVQEAVYITRFAKSVTLIHRRDRLRATAILQEKAKNNPKIRFKLESVVKSIQGGEQVESITTENVKTGAKEDLNVQGVFIFIGHVPNTEFLRDTVKKDDSGYILTDENMQTSLSGVFACGDARKKLLRQVVTACGEGAAAAFAAQEYVEEKRGTAYK
ncbi:MAG: thioredoxin-disulfide reductase [Endomicrobiales bacterium]|nr:thioredoxin-disulfide reductase [Endomicrobiales bacterium]